MKNGINFALMFNFQIAHPNFQFFAVMHTRKPHNKAWCKLFRFVSFQNCNIYRTLMVKSVMVILVRLIWKLLFVKRFFSFFPMKLKTFKKVFLKLGFILCHCVKDILKVTEENVQIYWKKLEAWNLLNDNHKSNPRL